VRAQLDAHDTPRKHQQIEAQLTLSLLAMTQESDQRRCNHLAKTCSDGRGKRDVEKHDKEWRQEESTTDPEHSSDIANADPQRGRAQYRDLMAIDDHGRVPDRDIMSASMNGWLYALECVALPCAIGIAMYVLFGVWDRRRRRVSDDNGLPPIDYSI
jgi:hypothetical protein